MREYSFAERGTHEDLRPQRRLVRAMMLFACAKADVETAVGAMGEGDDLESATVPQFVDLELKSEESIYKPTRELKPGARMAVDEKVWGGGTFRVEVGGGGYDVDCAPGGFDSLAVEGKVV